MSFNLDEIIEPAKNEPTPKNWKMIGFMHSPETDSKLTLLAATMSLDKSKLLRKIIDDWFDENDAVAITKEKIKEIRASYDGQQISLREFKSKFRSFFKRKKVYPDLIDEVLKDIV